MTALPPPSRFLGRRLVRCLLHFVCSGRPKKGNDAKHRQAQTLRDSGESVSDIANTLGVSVATVYRVTKTARDSLDAN
ncbi:helix-turn-helix domain-containing protein [Microbacterium oxydans]|uniref:helix-turn-helix domain-containing protein n=1 Tax=Microbacterium oxydans TaxID=82380 RepID=UPI003AFB58FC